MLNEDKFQNDVVTQIESFSLSENQNEIKDKVEKDQDNDKEPQPGIVIEIDSNQTCNTTSVSANHQKLLKKDNFYENAKMYWSKIPPTVDGMLGGFGNINIVDIRGSRAFFNGILKLKPAPNKRYALDCGAGIGRITKNLLLTIFECVDIVEQDRTFSQKAIEYIGTTDRIGKIYNVGLQEFIPEPKKYDIVWCQWVLGHLTDNDLVEFFKRIGSSISRDGMLIIKENVSSSDHLELDDVDSSMTRSLKMYQDLIKAANFRIIKVTKQTNFPKELFPVYFFACRPK